MTWKQKLVKVKQMNRDGKASLYDQAVLMREIWEDPGFREDAGDDITALDRLDAMLDGIQFSFNQLLAILSKYPDQQQWVDGNLREMHANVVVPRKQYRKAETTKTVPLERYNKLYQKHAELKEENKNLKKELRQAKRLLQIMREKLDSLHVAPAA
jgi:hypothetical protein